MGQRAYRDEYYPDESLEICQENIDGFFKFMYERHTIWENRYIKRLPREEWTNDKILKSTKYTNVYRQLDRGTIWYLNNVVRPYKKAKKKIDGNISSKEYAKRKLRLFKNLLWKTCMYRLCNKIETFEEIGLPDFYNFDPQKLMKAMKAIHERGDPVMTSAHLTCPTPKGLKKYEGYILACFDLFNKLDKLAIRIQESDEAEGVFNYLMKIHCIGGFTAYEIYCDLCYSHSIPFTTNDFVNVGPGAKEAIRLTYPNTKGLQNIEDRLRQLHKEQHEHFKNLGLEFPWYNKYEPEKNELSLRSIEHSLCEYSKYWLQSHGLGKKRMIFLPDAHCSIIDNTGACTKVNPDNNWKDKLSKPRNTSESKLIKLLREEGLSKDEMKDFIRRLRDENSEE